MKTPVLQFGTSRFLQAHADLFFSEGDPQQSVTVVQSSGDQSRAHRLAALAAPEGYPVRIRGMMDGQTIDETRRVTAIKRCLSTAEHWPEVTRIAIEEADYIISNTADAGYQESPEDKNKSFSQGMSYPAKLYHLLAARHAAGAGAVTVMPMELIVDNGKVLRNLVSEIGLAHEASDALMSFLRDEVIWVSSLVDRIVSAPIEPAGAVAEPYALWAIEAGPRVTIPTHHPSIQLVDDLQEIERLKLHILNLGHTAMVDIWKKEGATGSPLVRDYMSTAEVRAALTALYQEEILPVFAKAGQGDQAKAYLATTLERFANPFLDHKLSDIAQNHVQKVERRVSAFIGWARTLGYGGEMPRLSAIMSRARL